MNNLLSYSGITTKIKAMEANFVSKNDYQRIANLESTVDFIAFLKSHPGYSSIFTGMDEHEIHRGQAEGLFINGLYLDYAKIYRFANMEQRKNLDLIFFRYEVNILKACIQCIYNEDDFHDMSTFKPFFDNHSGINVKALAASHTMDEYINNLKGTEYYPLFIMLQGTHHTTPFDYEMQLDIYYFKKAWKLKDKLLRGDNLKAMTHSLGSEIDLLNILWLYRSKKFYDINSYDSYSYVIPLNYKLTKTQLTKLMESASIDEFISILKTTHYQILYPSLIDGTIEQACLKITSKIYKDNKADYPSSMAPVNSFLFHKQLEVKRIITALECIRYKLEPQDILKYILQ